MEYTDILTWYKLYPQLKPKNTVCLCGDTIAYKPWVRGDYVGIEALPCKCGIDNGGISTPRNKITNDKWIQFLKG